MTRHTLRAGTIHVGDWLEADLAPGYTLAIVDGPYGMGKAAWDCMGIDGLAEWYRPHLERVSELLAASASLYVWNTAEGWARLDPVVRERWGFVGLITWDKLHTPAQLGAERVTGPLDTTEVCGVYTRGGGRADASVLGFSVWQMAEHAYRSERLRSSEATPDRNPLRGLTFSALHPCQKPLDFADRMIRASTRPGERVLVPFGGTCREAVVCEWLARAEPEEARGYDVCELNQDPGRDYVAAVLAQINGEDTRRKAPGQVRLFGGS